MDFAGPLLRDKGVQINVVFCYWNSLSVRLLPKDADLHSCNRVWRNMLGAHKPSSARVMSRHSASLSAGLARFMRGKMQPGRPSVLAIAPATHPCQEQPRHFRGLISSHHIIWVKEKKFPSAWYSPAEPRETWPLICLILASWTARHLPAPKDVQDEVTESKADMPTRTEQSTKICLCAQY